MEIRRLNNGDTDALMDIANYYILNTMSIWQRDIRPRSFYEEYIAGHQDPYPAFAAVEDGVVVGYASLSPFRHVNGYDRICENSIYLKPEATGKGYGKALMKKLIDEAVRLDHWALTAWIDSENQYSIDFHKAFGFYETGVMRNIGNKGGKRLSVQILQLDIQ